MFYPISPFFTFVPCVTPQTVVFRCLLPAPLRFLICDSSLPITSFYGSTPRLIWVFLVQGSFSFMFVHPGPSLYIPPLPHASRYAHTFFAMSFSGAHFFMFIFLSPFSVSFFSFTLSPISLQSFFFSHASRCCRYPFAADLTK